MFSPVARVFDMHVCPMQTPAVVPIPHVGGPCIGPGTPTVMAGGMPVSVVGDILVCVGPPDVAVAGSATVLAMGRPVLRITDSTAHGGLVLLGCPTVLVGDSGGSGSSQGATMSAAKAGGSAFTRAECDKAAATSSQTQAVAPAPTGKSWVEVEVVDEDGKPMPYQRVQIVDSTGTSRIAFSDSTGVCRVDGVAKGECKVTLADLDRSSWS